MPVRMLPTPDSEWPAELSAIKSADPRLVESGRRGGLATAERRRDGRRPSDGPFPKWEYRRKMYLRRKLAV